MRITRYSMILFVVLLFSPLSIRTVRAQDPKLNVDRLEKLSSKATEIVDVTLDEPLIKLASKFLSATRSPDEAKVKELVSGLKGVYVKSFGFDKDGEYLDADVNDIKSQLAKPGWSRIAGVKNKQGQNFELYLMGGGDVIKGLAILAAEPKRLTVVNIVGNIDIEKLSQLEGHFGIPKMGFEKDDGTKKEEVTKKEDATKKEGK